MVIHFSILGVILAVSYFYERRFTRRKLNNPFYIMPVWPWLIIFGYITFLAAMRSGMNDTPIYISSFNGTVTGYQAIKDAIISDIDIKYWFMNVVQAVFKTFISVDYHIWFLFLAIIQTICFVHVFRRECYGIFIPCFFFFASSLYYNYFSMLRQWTALAIVFGAFEFLKKRQWIKYILCCVLAGLLHPSAFICIIFAFLSTGEPWHLRQNLIIAASAVGIVLLNPILSMLSAGDSTYDYAIQTMQGNTGSSPVRILISAVPVLLSLYCRKFLDREDDRGLDICVNMSTLYCILTVVASMTSGLYVMRLAAYLEPYNVILYSYLLRKGLKGRDRRYFVIAFCVIYLLYYYYAMSHMGSWDYLSDVLGNFH